MSFDTEDFVKACRQLEELDDIDRVKAAQLCFNENPEILPHILRIAMSSGLTKMYNQWISNQIASSITTIHSKKKEEQQNSLDDDEDDDDDIMIEQIDEAYNANLDEMPAAIIGHLSHFLYRHSSNALKASNRSTYLGVSPTKIESLCIQNKQFWPNINIKNPRFNYLRKYHLNSSKLKWSRFNIQSFTKLEIIYISTDNFDQLFGDKLNVFKQLNERGKTYEIDDQLTILNNVKNITLRGKNNFYFLTLIKPETVQKVNVDHVVLGNKKLFMFLSQTKKLRECSLSIIDINIDEKLENYLQRFPVNIDMFELEIPSMNKNLVSLKTAISEMSEVYNPCYLRLRGNDDMILRVIKCYKNIKRSMAILDIPLSQKLLNNISGSMNMNGINKQRLNVLLLETNQFTLKLLANDEINRNKERKQDKYNDTTNLCDIINCNDEWREDFTEKELLDILKDSKQYKDVLNAIKLNTVWISIKLSISPTISPCSIYDVKDSHENEILVDHDNIASYGYHNCLYKSGNKLSSCNKIYYRFIHLSQHTKTHRVDLKSNESVCECGRYCNQKSHRLEHNKVCRYNKKSNYY